MITILSRKKTYVVEAVGLSDGAVARREKVGEVALWPLAIDVDHELGVVGGGDGLETSKRSCRGGGDDDDDDDEHG